MCIVCPEINGDFIQAVCLKSFRFRPMTIRLFSNKSIWKWSTLFITCIIIFFLFMLFFSFLNYTWQIILLFALTWYTIRTEYSRMCALHTCTVLVFEVLILYYNKNKIHMANAEMIENEWKISLNSFILHGTWRDTAVRRHYFLAGISQYSNFL